MSQTISLKLKVWRQKSAKDKGGFENYDLPNVSPEASFLEMLDQLNEILVSGGNEPITFDHDCREGICGSCGFAINGQAHGPERGTTVCQLHMRKFSDGDTLVLEPFRARAFPVIRDLMVDRSSFDRIQKVGGYCSANTGNAPDANAMLIGKEIAEEAFEAAQCIGCGACVASCKNASASLFVSAKMGQYSLLPQGQPEKEKRTVRMYEQMEEEGFGACSNTLECEASCPKEISVKWISRMNSAYLKAKLTGQNL